MLTSKYVVVRLEGRTWAVCAWQDKKKAIEAEMAGSSFTPICTTLKQAQKGLKEAQKTWPECRYKIASVTCI